MLTNAQFLFDVIGAREVAYARKRKFDENSFRDRYSDFVRIVTKAPTYEMTADSMERFMNMVMVNTIVLDGETARLFNPLEGRLSLKPDIPPGEEGEDILLVKRNKKQLDGIHCLNKKIRLVKIFSNEENDYLSEQEFYAGTVTKEVLLGPKEKPFNGASYLLGPNYTAYMGQTLRNKFYHTVKKKVVKKQECIEIKFDPNSEEIMDTMNTLDRIKTPEEIMIMKEYEEGIARSSIGFNYILNRIINKAQNQSQYLAPMLMLKLEAFAEGRKITNLEIARLLEMKSETAEDVLKNMFSKIKRDPRYEEERKMYFDFVNTYRSA